MLIQALSALSSKIYVLLAGVRGPVGALRTRAAQGVLREEGDARGAGRDGPRGLAGALVEDQLVAPERLVSRTMPETVKCKASITCNKVLILLSKSYISCNVLLQYNTTIHIRISVIIIFRKISIFR